MILLFYFSVERKVLKQFGLPEILVSVRKLTDLQGPFLFRSAIQPFLVQS